METVFRKKSKEWKDAWKCTECSKVKKGEDKKKTDDKENEEVKEDAGDETSIKSMLQAMERRMTQKMEDVDRSAKFNSQQYDEIKVLLEDMKIKVNKILKKQDELEKENIRLKQQICEVEIKYEERIDTVENRSRISNLEIKNVPESPGEDVVQIVKNIGAAIGITNIAEGDIQVAHRVDQRNKERGQRPIIAHMASRYLRNKWLNLYKDHNKKKGNLTANAVHPNLPKKTIYLNEHITVPKKILLKEVKEFARSKEIKYVWVKDSQILLKKDERSNHVQKINTKRELEEYKRKFNPTFGK